MQLTVSARRSSPPSPPYFVAVAALLVAAMVAGSARGSDSSDTDQTATSRDEGSSNRKKAETLGPLEDTATEHAALEIAGYNDSDHVTVVTPSITAGIDNVSGGSLNASYLVDIVSAASADIVSTASRRWEEIRQAGSLAGQYKPHDFGVGVGGSVSREPDYLSYGVYATVVKDFDEKNWTLNFGYGFSHDTAGRCGGEGGPGPSCTPFSVFSRQLQRGSFNGGIAWVVDRASLASVSADVIIENGDQSKVYRYIPLFSPSVAASMPNGASIDYVNSVRLPERPLEQLPLERRRFALTGRYAHRFDGSTLRLEERFYDDDWGLVASSTDARWIFDLGKRFVVWPHARLHVQGSASFWQKAYVSNNPNGSPNTWDIPLYRTGDRELGPLWTTEGGLGIKWYLGKEADPRSWQLGFSGDAMYTAYLDDLYVTNRTAFLGAFTLEAEF
ncbi:MAG: DUF3570 domain-containing protein [Polyangiaceae bacterium]|jgi:hypothetical protein